MRRRSRTLNIARRRRRMLWALALLVVVAVASTQCRTTDGPQQAHGPDGPAPSYRSLSGGGSGGQGTGASERLRPANHQVDWLERHGAVARANSDDCTDCHVEEDCSSCHTENLSRPFQVHPPNFETIHAVDARLDLDNCTDCHKPETFCAGCHARTGVTAIEPNDPPPRFEFHPPGWLDNNAPNNHGVAARRNITECTSCHQERDCVTCHQGINPHPPEFRFDCGSWLEADARSCAKCHRDVESLRGMCL